MDSTRQLYDLLTSNGFSMPFEQFEQEMGFAEGRRGLYDNMKSNGLVGETSFESFESHFFKKKSGGSDLDSPSSPTSPSSSESPNTSASPTEQPEDAAAKRRKWAGLYDFATNPDEISTEPKPAELTNERTADGRPLMPVSQDYGKFIEEQFSLTGDENPVEMGRQLESMQVGERKMAAREKYESRTEARQAARETRHIATYGNQLEMQKRFAEDRMAQEFGEDWKQRLEVLSKEIQGMGDPSQLTTQEQVGRYNDLVFEISAFTDNPNFARLTGAEKGQEAAFQSYKSVYDRYPEYAKQERKREMMQSWIDQNKWATPGAFVGKTIGKALTSVMGLPRAVGKGTAEFVGLNTEGDWGIADELGSLGDEIANYMEREAPMPQRYSQRVLRTEVPFKNLKVEVKDGKPVSAFNADGQRVEMTAEDKAEFEASGVAKDAQTEFTGVGNMAWKGLEVFTDLMIMRYAGGGTKLGTVISSGAMIQGDAFREAMRDPNMTPEKAAEYALGTAAAQGVVEAYLGNLESTVFKTGAVGAVRGARQTLSREMAQAVVSGKVSPFRAGLEGLKHIGKQTFEENLEELAQGEIDRVLKMGYNAETGSRMETAVDPNEMLETALLVTLVTMPMAAVGAGGKVNQFKSEALLTAVDKPELFYSAMGELAAGGVITEQEADAQNRRIQLLSQQSQSLPSQMSEGTRALTLALQDARNQAQQVVESNAPDAMKKIARERIKQYDERIEAMVEPFMREEGERVEDIEIEENEPSEVVQPAAEVVATPALSNEVVNAPEDVAAPVAEPIEDAIADTQTFDPFAGINRVHDAPMAIPVALSGMDTETVQASATRAAAMMNEGATISEIIDEMPDEMLRGDALASVAQTELSRLGQELDENESIAFRTFIASHFDGDIEGDAAQLIGDLVSEWRRGGNKKGKLTSNFLVETPEDAFAEFFSEGGQLSRAGWERMGDTNHQVSNLYFSQNGRQFDDFATEVAERFNMDAQEVEQRLADFIMDRPNRNLREYVEGRVAQQQGQEIERQAVEAYDAAVAGNTLAADEKVAEVVDVDAKAEAAIAGMTEADQQALDGFLDSFDSIEAAHESYVEHIEGFEPRWLEFEQAHPAAYEELVKILNSNKNETETETLEPDAQRAGEVETTTQAAEQNQSQDAARTAGGENQVGVSKAKSDRLVAEVDNLQGGYDPALDDQVSAALAAIEPPSRVTGSMLATMLRAGMIAPDVAIHAQSALNGATDVRALQALETANAAIPLLKNVAEADVTAFENERLESDEVQGVRILPNGGFIVPNVGEDVELGYLLQVAGGRLVNGEYVFADNESLLVVSQLMSNNNAPANEDLPVEGSDVRAQTNNNTFAKFAFFSLASRLRRAKTTKSRLAELKKALAGRQHTFERTVIRLRQAFPNIEIIADPQAIVDALARMGFVGDNPPNAFVFEGRVYMAESMFSSETPIHEVGHLWSAFTAAIDPDLHQAGLEAMRGSEYEAFVRESEQYKHLQTDEEILDEALAQAIGERGARMVSANTWERFNDWLTRFWTSISGRLGFNVEHTRAVQFADMVASRLLEGNEITSLTSDEMAGVERRGVFLRQAVPLAAKMEAAGIEATEIEQVLGLRRALHGTWTLVDPLAPVVSPRTMVEGSVIRAFDVSDGVVVGENTPVLEVDGIEQGAYLLDGKVVVVNGSDLEFSLRVAEAALRVNAGLLELPDVNAELRAQAADMAEAIASTLNPVVPDSAAQADMEEAEAMGVDAPTVRGFDQRGHSPKAKFLFARSRTMSSVTLTAARLIILQDVADNGLDNMLMVIRELEQMGIDPVQTRLIYSEAMRGVGRNRIAVRGGALAFAPNSMLGKVVEGLRKLSVWNKSHLGMHRGLPSEIYHANLIREAGIAAAMKEWEFAARDAAVAMKKHFNGQLPQAALAQVHLALEGQLDWMQIPASYRGHWMRVRKQIDRLSRELVIAGVVAPETALKILESAGVDTHGFYGSQRTALAAIASKRPSERSAGEQESLEIFINMNARRVGTYLTRQYRLHHDKNWKSKIPEHVRARAEMYVRAELEKRRAELEEMRDTVPEKVQARIAELRAKIDAEVAKASAVLTDTNAKIDDLIAALEQETIDLQATMKELADKMAESVKEKGKVNKSLARSLAARAKRVKVLNERLKKMKEVENFTAADLEIIENASEEVQFQQDRALAKLYKLVKEREQAGEDMSAFNDIPILESSAATRRVVKMLERIAELEQKKKGLSRFKQEELDMVNARLSNVAREVEAMVSNTHKEATLFGKPKPGSKNMDILTRRQEIAEELRELYGEFQDPFISAALTIKKMSTLLEAQRFLLYLRDDLEGVYFFDPKKKIPSHATTQIAAPESDAMAPLNGWYTTPEIYDAMSQYYETWDWWLDFPFLKQFHWFASKVKVGLTIYSPQTHTGNFASNGFIAFVNGWFSMKDNKKAYLSFRAAMNKGIPVSKWLFSKGRDFIANPLELSEQEYIAKLTRLGVLGDSLNAGMMADAVKAFDVNEDYSDKKALQRGSSASDFDSRALVEAKDVLDRNIGKAHDIATGVYQAEDEFFKILGFEGEKKNYARWWYGTTFEKLTSEQQDRVERKAAEVVTSELPTFSRLPKLAQFLRVLPFSGTFIAFPYEMFRVSYNIMARTMDMIRELNPDVRKSAISRLLRLNTIMYVLPYAMPKLAMFLLGWDDDDEEAMRRFSAPWQRNGELIPLPAARSGDLRYIDLSWRDPFAFMHRAVNAMTRNNGRDFPEQLGDALLELHKPFTDPELTFNVIKQVAQNRKDLSGKPVYNDQMDGMFGLAWTHPDNLHSIYSFGRKQLMPGFIKTIDNMQTAMDETVDYMGNVKTLQDIGISHLGVKVQQVDPSITIGYNIRAYVADKAKVRAIFKDVEQDLNTKRYRLGMGVQKGEVSEASAKAQKERLDAQAKEMLPRKYAMATEAYQKLLDKAKEELRLGNAVGVNLGGESVSEALKGFNNSEKAYIFGQTEVYPVLKFKD